MERLTEILVKFCPPFILACYLDLKYIYGMVLVLLLIDNIVAVSRAYKFREDGNWFNYKKLFKTIDKFISYGLALIVAWVVEQIVAADFGLTKFVAGYIAIYEAISIFSHLSRITGLTLFADAIEWLKEKADFKKYIKKGKNDETDTTENT